MGHDSRYRIVAPLGSGGMGVVYEVEDLERQENVALKTFTRPGPDQLFLLKREFRALADLSHPNLVTFYDLFVDGDRCFYTMELIKGVELCDYVQSNEAKLKSTLIGLIAGLCALHRAGKVHRDVKPSNVLVTPEGRVVLLDFGIVANRGGEVEDAFGDTIVGTPSYMAPEQAESDAKVTPAADWYAMGTIVYKILTGELPFKGTPSEKLALKRSVPAPSPREVLSSVPEFWDDVCRALLATDPSARPSADEILERLGLVSTPRLDVAPRPAVEIFAGREDELQTLRDAFSKLKAGAPNTVLVKGESGIGKTTLIRTFLEELRSTHVDLVVLEGRCYERETVPYKAIDGVIDGLSSYWKRIPHSEAMALLPRDADLLARVFPVLGRVREIASAPKLYHTTDVHELSARAFGAFRETLERLGRHSSLVLFLDDLQWIDSETVSVLQNLMRPPNSPHLLLLLTGRDLDTQDGLAHRLLKDTQCSTVAIEVKALSDDEAFSLASRLLGTQDTDTARLIAQESAGSPFFVGQLSQHLGHRKALQETSVNVGKLLTERIRALPPGLKQLLELLVIAGQPISQHRLGNAAGLTRSAASRDVQVLLSNHLARTVSGSDAEFIEPYHDRIRAAVRSMLDPEQRQACHRRWAESIHGSADEDAELCVQHWFGAGEPARASAFARTAAEQAVKVLAFDRAASLYRLCVEGENQNEGGADPVLLTQFADTLAHAGRGQEAAEVYFEVAKISESTRAAELKRLAGLQLLKCGFVDAGIEALTPSLREYRLPVSRSPIRSIFRIVLTQLWLNIRHPGFRFKERPEHEVPAEQLSRLDFSFETTIGLFNFDQLKGVELHAHNLMLALSAGEPRRVALALSTEVVGMAVRGVDRERVQTTIDRVKAFADGIDDHYLQAVYYLTAGVADHLQGCFLSSIRKLKRALPLLRECCAGAWWEVNTAYLNLTALFVQCGKLRELKELVPTILREAVQRGDLYAMTSARSGFSNVAWLVDDDEVGARQAIDAATQQWSQKGFHLQHFFQLYARIQIELYSGNALQALQIADDSWKTLKRSGQLATEYNLILALELRARCLLAADAPNPATQRRRLQGVQRIAKRLKRIRRPLALAHATNIEAQVLAANEAREESILAFKRAGELYDALDMRLHEASIKYLIGLTARTEEERIHHSMYGKKYFSMQDVRRPDKLLRLLVPIASLYSDTVQWASLRSQALPKDRSGSFGSLTVPEFPVQESIPTSDDSTLSAPTKTDNPPPHETVRLSKIPEPTVDLIEKRGPD